MAKYDATERFWKDYSVLGPHKKTAFMDAVEKFKEDLPSSQFRKGLRVKGVQNAKGVFEMTWADDGRATFEYGRADGDLCIVWRRVGTHQIFDSP